MAPSSKAAFHFPAVPISSDSDFCSTSYHRCDPATGFHTQTKQRRPPSCSPLCSESSCLEHLKENSLSLITHTHSHQKKINPPFKHQRINDLNLNVPYIYRQNVVWCQAYLPFFLMVCIEKDCVCVTCAAEGGSPEPFQEFCTWVSH